MDSTLSDLRIVLSSLELETTHDLALMAREIRVVASRELSAGDKYPTVELSDVAMTEANGVQQDWTVRYKDKEAKVRTLTSSDGEISIMDSGNDIPIWGKNEGEWSPIASSNSIVMFIVKNAHPRHYPALGETVTVDDSFISDFQSSQAAR